MLLHHRHPSRQRRTGAFLAAVDELEMEQGPARRGSVATRDADAEENGGLLPGALGFHVARGGTQVVTSKLSHQAPMEACSGRELERRFYVYMPTRCLTKFPAGIHRWLRKRSDIQLPFFARKYAYGNFIADAHRLQWSWSLLTAASLHSFLIWTWISVRSRRKVKWRSEAAIYY